MAKVPTRRRHKSTLDEEINLIPVMNLFMVLIPFLLLTAVFAKTAVIDIYLPAAAIASNDKVVKKAASAPTIVLTIHVTKKGFRFTGLGKGIGEIKTANNKYDFTALSKELVKLKEKYPTKEEVILLFEAATSYEVVVKMMDTTRELIEKKGEKSTRKHLFPLVSVGQTEVKDNKNKEK
ncbi:MAG: biopolymer transporter ExbD [Deltaproteobacteria bacterium]|nr:biopolymer transporter ExbD [Deltaproteobacteria bacterium]